LCEADQEETQRLRGQQVDESLDGVEIEVLDAVVAGVGAEEILHVYASGDLSSLYELAPGVSYRYGQQRKVNEIVVKTTSLDELSRERSIEPHFLSIDAQGATLRILEGGRHVLEGALAIRCELEFFPMYVKAPLAHESMEYLSQAGYSMTRIEMCGPGFFGISSEMNRFSVSPWDARPSSCDAIFVNSRLVRGLLGKPAQNAFQLIYLISFLIHNGCGYLGIEYLSELSQKSTLDTVLGVVGPSDSQIFLSLVEAYLLIPRRNVNADFEGALVIRELLGERAGLITRLDNAVQSKIDAIYQTWTP